LRPKFVKGQVRGEVRTLSPVRGPEDEIAAGVLAEDLGNGEVVTQRVDERIAALDVFGEEGCELSLGLPTGIHIVILLYQYVLFVKI
jgi:hypothetical protein